MYTTTLWQREQREGADGRWHTGGLVETMPSEVHGHLRIQDSSQARYLSHISEDWLIYCGLTKRRCWHRATVQLCQQAIGAGAPEISRRIRLQNPWTLGLDCSSLLVFRPLPVIKLWRYGGQSQPFKHNAAPVLSLFPQSTQRRLNRPLNRKRWHLYRWIEGIERTKPALLFRYATSQTIASVLSPGFCKLFFSQSLTNSISFSSCHNQENKPRERLRSSFQHRLQSQITGNVHNYKWLSITLGQQKTKWG